MAKQVKCGLWRGNEGYLEEGEKQEDGMVRDYTFVI